MAEIAVWIDAGVMSPLQWDAGRAQGEAIAAGGDKILWHLDMGLFSGLQDPLSDEQQFRSLCLAVDHFNSTLYPPLASATAGVSIYQGSADLSGQFLWDDEADARWKVWLDEGCDVDPLFAKEVAAIGKAAAKEVPRWRRLFCRDLCTEYLALLAARLHEEVVVSVQLVTPRDLPPIEGLELIAKDAYEHIEEVVIGMPCGLERGAVAKVGLVWPGRAKRARYHYERLSPAVARLAASGQPWRLIPETLITSLWDALDDLVIDRAILSPEGERMVEGFLAAGGRCLSVGDISSC